MAFFILRINRIADEHVNAQIIFITKRLLSQISDKISAEKSNAANLTTNRVTNFSGDMIGPAHPISNLRPTVWYRSKCETRLQRKLKNFQEATQSWNQNFWELHNSNFHKERKMYIQKHLPNNKEKQTLTADEMSNFYKEFLDKNWRNHVTYNFEWYKKNLMILFLSVAVQIEKIFVRS